MGVDIGQAQWSYSGFSEFRRRLAAADGIDLDYMYGFGLPADVATPWDSVSTPLRPLLDHSDCDGDLSPEECAQVAPRLAEICESWSATGDLAQDYDRRSGLVLAEEMRAAAAAGHRLVFH